jgi:ribosomal protein S18 acetylase RimI-like enzyme
MLDIRPVRPDDIDALYHIALLTGASGQDASELYEDGSLVGHIWAAPYASLEPASALVVVDADGVAGYIVGALDTRAFEARLEAEWWPALRPRYVEPPRVRAAAWTVDETASYLIHHPLRAPDELVGPFPSHLHINLLPRLQGTGVGATLISRWLNHMHARGSRGVHFAVSRANDRALRFYRKYGFAELALHGGPRNPPVWFGMALPVRSAGS